MKPYDNLDSVYTLLLFPAVSTTLYNFLNPESPFGAKVYSSGLINIDELTALNDPAGARYCLKKQIKPHLFFSYICINRKKAYSDISMDVYLV